MGGGRKKAEKDGKTRGKKRSGRRAGESVFVTCVHYYQSLDKPKSPELQQGGPDFSNG